MKRTYYGNAPIENLFKKIDANNELFLCCQKEREGCKREQRSCLKHCRKITGEE